MLRLSRCGQNPWRSQTSYLLASKKTHELSHFRLLTPIAFESGTKEGSTPNFGRLTTALLLRLIWHAPPAAPSAWRIAHPAPALCPTVLVRGIRTLKAQPPRPSLTALQSAHTKNGTFNLICAGLDTFEARQLRVRKTKCLVFVSGDHIHSSDNRFSKCLLLGILCLFYAQQPVKDDQDFSPQNAPAAHTSYMYCDLARYARHSISAPHAFLSPLCFKLSLGLPYGLLLHLIVVTLGKKRSNTCNEAEAPLLFVAEGAN